jgi:Flp pilus assembly protein TadD
MVRLTADAALSPEEPDLRRVVQKTGASLVLTGTVQRSGDTVRVTYSLLQAPQGVQVGGHKVDGAASDIFAIEDEIAENVLLSLGLKASLPSRPPGLKGVDAQERYLKAVGKLQRYDVASSVEEGIQSLEELARREPESAIVQAALAGAYLHKYELTRDRAWAEQASAACERARRLDSELPEVHLTLGQLLALTGKPLDAAAEFERALAQRPNSVEALLGLAAAHKSAGNMSKAEATYRRAIALQPNYWAVYNHLGAFYFGRGQYPQAIDMFQKVVRLEPDSVRGYNNLGAAYHRSGEFAQAREAYRKSIRLKPSDGAYSNLGTTEYFLGNYRDAATAFEQAVKLTPGKFLYWANLADAYRWAPELRSHALDAYDRAVRLAEQALSLNPRDASAHATLAVCFAKTGNLATARVHVERALEIEPDDPQHLYDAATVAVLDGKPQEAITLIRSAIARGLAAKVVESEPEFKSLRDQPEFRDALAAKRVEL